MKNRPGLAHLKRTLKTTLAVSQLTTSSTSILRPIHSTKAMVCSQPGRKMFKYKGSISSKDFPHDSYKYQLDKQQQDFSLRVKRKTNFIFKASHFWTKGPTTIESFNHLEASSEWKCCQNFDRSEAGRERIFEFLTSPLIPLPSMI